MKKILIYGDNLISTFLINALTVLNYDVVDITSLEKYDEFFGAKQIEAIIDVANATEMADDEEVLFHNNEGICDILQLCCDTNIPLLFLYKEPKDLSPENALSYALENIKKFTRRGAMFANIQIEDVYGPDIITSAKINEYIHAISNYENIDLSEKVQEYFMIHQRDFMSGLIAIIKEIRLLNKSKNYTLMPESPISDIELGELIASLSASSINFEYALETDFSRASLDIETNYPINWYPNTDINTGIKELFEAYGITKSSQLSEKSGISEELDGDIDQMDQMDEINTIDAINTSEPIRDILEPAKIDNDDIENESQEQDNLQSIDSDTFAEVNVDQIPTKIEYGAKYYRPEPTQDTQNSQYKSNANNEKQKKPSLGKIQQKLAITMSVLLFAATFIPTTNYYGRYVNSLTLLNSSLELFSQGEYAKSYEKASSSIENAKKLTQIPLYVKLYSKITNKDLQSIKNGSDQIAYTSELVTKISLIKTSVQNDNGSVLGAKSIETSPKVELDRVSELISLIDSNKDPVFLSSNINTPNSQIAIKAASDIYRLRNANLYEVLGFTYPQKYLVVTTDETKSTRTGGRILNLIEMDIDKGEIKKSTLFDIEQIKEQVQLNKMTPKADAQIMQYLSSAYLPFEYSNDFSEFKNFSLYLTDLIQKLEKTPKYDGVMQVSNSNYTKIFSKSQSNINIDELILSLNEKHLMIWNKNPQILSGLYQNAWAGNIPKYKNDMIGIYETAVGENGNSSLIKRSLEYTVNIPSQDPIIEKLTKIAYVNTGKETYIAKVGILTPRNTTINEVIIKNTAGDVNITRSAEYKNVGLYDEISFIIDILPGTEKVVDLSYSTQINNLKDTLSIQMYSQPLNTIENLKVFVKYQNIPQLQVKAPFSDKGYIFYDESLSKDKTIEIPL